jgi:hypothetical protein
VKLEKLLRALFKLSNHCFAGFILEITSTVIYKQIGVNLIPSTSFDAVRIYKGEHMII